jgi:YD repeat-containing protein
MPGNLSALNRFIPPVWVFTALLLWLPGLAGAQEQWYRSNAAGMALESGFSRLVLRENKYALSVKTIPPADLPEALGEYYIPEYQIELRTLYEEGRESRRQWVFRDGSGLARIVAAGELMENADDEEPVDENDDESRTELGDTPDSPPGINRIQLIELYNEQGLITEEHRLDRDGTDQISRYYYNGQFLLRAETLLKTPAAEDRDEKTELLCTDYSRYTRSASLRSVERVFPRPEPAEQAAEGAEGEETPQRITFPRLVWEASANNGFVNPGSAYGSDFFQDILTDSSSRVLYTVDDRGRILTETRQDESGTILGELTNRWSADRLLSVRWKAGEDERLTEYEYDGEGDRIEERNYNKGILERVVRRVGDREVEELYMNNRVVLRAIWENGRKISEERVRAAPGGE